MIPRSVYVYSLFLVILKLIITFTVHLKNKKIVTFTVLCIIMLQSCFRSSLLGQVNRPQRENAWERSSFRFCKIMSRNLECKEFRIKLFITLNNLIYDSWQKTRYGMLHHAFEPLEGSNLLWHIVGPSPPVPPIFSLFLIILYPIWFKTCLFGLMFDGTWRSRGQASHVSSLFSTTKRRVW